MASEPSARLAFQRAKKAGWQRINRRKKGPFPQSPEIGPVPAQERAKQLALRGVGPAVTVSHGNIQTTRTTE